MTPAAGASLQPGDRVGGYELLELLGQGGMGAVFRVRAASGEELALKLLLDARSSPKRRQRFTREAQVLQFLGRHPGIVALRDLGMDCGRAYLVMDLVRGGTLADPIAAGDVERGVRLLIRVARAVHFAHEAGVIHRDLKPSNVLLGEGDHPVVADFGLAKDVQAESLTGPGEVVGTVAYMAPEQVRGRGYDRRTDVYALGALLYELLAGRPPFAGDTPLAVLAQIVEARPRPPSAWAGARPAAPALEAVCLRALAKDASARPPTAEQLARELEAALDGERPLVVAGASPRALRLSVLGNGALALLLALTGALFALSGGSAPRDFDAAAYRVARGEPLAPAELAALAERGAGEPWGRWVPYLAAQSALARADATARELVRALPAGPERALLEVELLAAPDPQGALAALEAGELAALPWRTEPPAARWEALAARLARAGHGEAAARAWLRAGQHALRAGEPRARCLAALEAAWRAAPRLTAREGRALAPLLLEAARELLAGAPSSPPATTLGPARAALTRYRLLEPARPIPPELLAPLEPAVVSGDWALDAAFPGFTRLGPLRQQLLALFARPLTPEELDAIRCGFPDTFPTAWQPFFTRERQLESADRIAILETVLLWRPELRPLWFDLGWALERERRYEEALHAMETVLHSEETAHVTYRAGRYHLTQGRLEEAARLAARTLELDRERDAFDPYHTLLQGEVLLRRGEVADALPVLERALESDRIAGVGWVWELKASALRALDRPRDADEALEHARRCAR